MIKLNVENYCGNCDEFTPATEVDTKEYYDFIHCRTVVDRDTVVVCEHRERCRCIHEYIKEKVNEQIY